MPREAWVRNRTRQTIERWRRERIITLSAEAEASLMRWVLTGKADDPLAEQINPPEG